MAAYSKKQLEAAWVRNGGKRSAAAMGAAIAYAESKGGQEPYGDRGLGGAGPTSFGPWQIHTPAHPQYSPQLLVSNLDYSAKAAIAVSNNGTDWSPWTTFKTGAYKPYLSGGGNANASFFSEIPKYLEGPLGGPTKEEEELNKLGESVNPLNSLKAPVEAVESVGSALGAIGKTLSTLDEWLTDPLRIVKLVGGGVITIMGLHSLTRGSVGGTVVQTTRAAPTKALSLAKRAATAGAEA